MKAYLSYDVVDYFLKMIPNKSIMTSDIKLPYVRLFHISVILDFTNDYIKRCFKNVSLYFINACFKRQ